MFLAPFITPPSPLIKRGMREKSFAPSLLSLRCCDKPQDGELTTRHSNLEKVAHFRTVTNHMNEDALLAFYR